jgi:hypothetical protein
MADAVQCTLCPLEYCRQPLYPAQCGFVCLLGGYVCGCIWDKLIIQFGAGLPAIPNVAPFLRVIPHVIFHMVHEWRNPPLYGGDGGVSVGHEDVIDSLLGQPTSFYQRWVGAGGVYVTLGLGPTAAKTASGVFRLQVSRRSFGKIDGMRHPIV